MLGVKAAESQIADIAAVNKGGLYDTITILGFSYGGEAALQAASWLKDKGIAVDLAVTCDPVPSAVTVDGKPFPYSRVGAMPDQKPANVTNWYNIYQQFDTDSASGANMLHWGIGFPTNIYGRSITGATNREVTKNTGVDQAGKLVINPKAAHTTLAKSWLVTIQITKAITALSSGRTSYKY